MELNFETPFSTKVTTADDYYFDSDDPESMYVNDVKKPKLVKKIKNPEKSPVKKKKIKVKGDGPTVMKKKSKKNSKNDKEETKGEQPPKKPKMKLEALHHTLPINLKECREQFFESGCKVNPIFEYGENKRPQEFMI